MPIYEYKCRSCGRVKEVLILHNEKEPNVCPFCGGPLVKLLSSGVGFVFKGSGFYITDYVKKEEKKGEKEGEKGEN
jgi:putative FmdB family regulatory protein